MKQPWNGLKKRSVNGLASMREIGTGIIIYLIALILLCLGGVGVSTARAQVNSWEHWNGKDPRSKGSITADPVNSPDEKREKIRKFGFVKEAIRFRLNQSFFDMGTESFEEILKSMGFIDGNTKILRFYVQNTDPNSQKLVKDANWLQYKHFKSQVKLRTGGLSIKLDTFVSDGIIYKTNWNTTTLFGGDVTEKCLIRMRGPLKMTIDAQIDESKQVVITIPQMVHEGFEMKAKGCSSSWFLGQGVTEGLISRFGPGQLQTNLQELFASVFNAEDGAGAFLAADFAKELGKKGIFVNAPSINLSSTSQVKTNFKVELGFLGFLSNNNGSMNLKISNPKNDYVNVMGFEWVLNSGFESRSKNILGLSPAVPQKTQKGGFQGWGVAPKQKQGEAVEFDAAASLSEAYVGSLFNALFNSGFFNWQIQDKVVNAAYSINPIPRKALFEEKLPNGDVLTEANYSDARLRMNMMAPPTLGLQDDETIVLTIPKFHLEYFAKVKGIEREVKLLEFDSKFRLKAKLNFTEDAKFRFDFSDQPVTDFEVLERKVVVAHVSDQQLFDAVNAEVARILSTVEVDLPLLKGRKLDVTYLGIDGSTENGKNLSVYLKVSKKSQPMK